MLDTYKFTNFLIEDGFTHLVVVPCSFAKSLINAAINFSDRISYLPCASEAVACSVATGLQLSGKRPLVIVQSSGLTNMGSCITSLLKPYGIKIPIIVSWRTYSDGDSEIQHAHLSGELPKLIAAYGYKHQLLSQESERTALQQLEACERDFLICVLKNDTFSHVNLDSKKLNLKNYPKRSEYLKFLNGKFSGSKQLFIGTTGNTAREMGVFMPNTSNFYMAGNMGGALTLGLGAALAGHEVYVCGGDAEFVMHMGGISTVGRYANKVHSKLVYIMFDNESNKSTGGQRTYQEHLDYGKIVSGCGVYVMQETITRVEDLKLALEDLEDRRGVYFIHAKSSYDPENDRPTAEVIIDSKKAFLLC